jgi:hypothetical protein
MKAPKVTSLDVTSLLPEKVLVSAAEPLVR